MSVHPLKAFMDRERLTQQQLAHRLGVNRVNVTRWINGTRKPDVGQLTKIAEVTGIPASELRPDIAAQMGAAQ